MLFVEENEVFAGLDDPVLWHKALEQAFKLELEEYLHPLDFKNEYTLNTAPLKIDLLIIKKLKNADIAHPIARIFRGTNIVEFKSHTDHISIADFEKVCAYMFLYAHTSGGTADGDDKKVYVEDMTLTLVCEKYPRVLIKYLKDVWKCSVSAEVHGIHLVEGYMVPVQFLETKKLSKENGAFLHVLTRNSKAETLNYVIGELKKSHKMHIEAFLHILLSANLSILKEGRNMASKSMDDILEELGFTERWEARGQARG
jgi:hypothetical protein